MKEKKVALITFPGGRVEIRTAGEYKDRETGEIKQSRAGTFICTPDLKYPLDISDVDLAVLCESIRKNKLAQQILKENAAANQ